ncbi:MAG: NAD-dependent dehydratase [Desulfuromonas sp.]|nr:MAG: NAD-dependent dehydratase [Desulfuromonas sp.]
MRVFVTGGTGFVGREILQQLTAAGHTVRSLARGGKRRLDLAGVECVPGDITDSKSLDGLLEGCDAVIHLVGIIREFPSRGITFERLHVEATRNMLAAATEQKVPRFIHMSANGSRENAATAYHFSKWRAEQAVRDSALAWTVFRPSLIYGRSDQFVNLLAGMIRKLPLVPVLGDGQYRLSPVAVEDVARGFIAALSREESIAQNYACGGPQAVTYDQLLKAVAVALRRSPPCILHHPVSLMRPVIYAFERFSAFPITSEQLTMLLEGNVCDPEEWRKAFDLTLTPLAAGLQQMLGGNEST